METTNNTRSNVREFYGKIGEKGATCCAPDCCTEDKQPSVIACCGDTPIDLSASDLAKLIGYGDEIDTVPGDANLGLGCGNPTAIAALKQGERVLDLGSGAGIDCFLAAQKVGPTGHVIGVDMTASMLDRARANAKTGGATQVEFRLGEIEHLPVLNDSVDVVMSNCVINLSDDKQRVYNESFRVLSAGGRLAISDIVAIQPIPEHLVQDVTAHVACVSGAAQVTEIEQMLTTAGFTNINIVLNRKLEDVIEQCAPGMASYVCPATIEATKPGA